MRRRRSHPCRARAHSSISRKIPMTSARPSVPIAAYDYPHVLAYCGSTTCLSARDSRPSGSRDWRLVDQRHLSLHQRSALDGSPEPGQGLCDPSDFTGGGFDTCRPILNSPSAPFTSVGVCIDATAADCGITDEVSGNPSTLGAGRIGSSTISPRPSSSVRPSWA